jgi:MFS family permease
MLLVAVPVQVYDLTGSTLAVGLVALTQFVPLVTLTILGGGIADAVDRRRLLLLSSAGVALSVAGFVANALAPEPQLWASSPSAFSRGRHTRSGPARSAP